MLSFASKAKDIVDITETDTSGNIEDVIYNLMNFDYNSRTLFVSPYSLTVFIHLTTISFDLLQRISVLHFVHPQATGTRRAPTSTPACTVSAR